MDLNTQLIPNEMSDCHECGSEINVATRKFRWHVRPRRGGDYWDVLEQELCHDCYQIVYEYSVEADDSFLIGRGWWDAYDGIYFTIDDRKNGIWEQRT